MKLYPTHKQTIVKEQESTKDSTIRKLEQMLVQAQRYENIGRLAASAIHDINNILSVIGGTSSLIRYSASKNIVSTLKYIEDIENAVDRARMLTTRLLGMCRPGTEQKKPLRPDILLNDLTKMFQRLLSNNRISIILLLQEETWHVLINEAEFIQVIVNLIVNAQDAMPNGGVISISTRNAHKDDIPSEWEVPKKDYVIICVTDTGTGIPRENIDKIFQPGFTTKEKGTGLGLATTYGIVKNAGGHISVASTPGVGTSFLIMLPRHIVTQEAPPEHHRRTQDGKDIGIPIHGSGSILLVDDSREVLEVLLEMLELLGYEVTAETSPKRALEIVSRLPDEFDLVIVDFNMPDMNGDEFDVYLSGIAPDLPVLFISGCNINAARKGEPKRQWPFLPKPFTIHELSDIIEKVMIPKRRG